MLKSVQDVLSWLTENGFEDYASTFQENKIDGTVLFCLTERASEILIPNIRDRMMFLKVLEELKINNKSTDNEELEKEDVVSGTDGDSTVTIGVIATKAGQESSKEAMKETRKKKKNKHSLESKRKQRLARNSRKREEEKQVRKGLSLIVNELKQANKCLTNKAKLAASVKEKYFEMWRISEKEKEMLKTSKLTFLQAKNLQSSLCSQANPTEILRIDPSMLQNVVEGHGVIGKGRFGTVHLKKYRSTSVAVKYFGSSSTAKMVEKEAFYLSKCHHINLPLMFGMNNNEQPYFIVTQFYGNDCFQAMTLRNVVNKECSAFEISAPEHWLHIVTQIADSLHYLHGKKILHNDIKNDNILIVNNSGSLFSPILVDFGKAHEIGKVKKRVLSKEEQLRYHREHCHIAPEVVDGAHPYSVKSDVYSVGIVLASIYKYSSLKPLKEVAKHCLKPFSTRCTSLQLLNLVKNLGKLFVE